MNETGDDGGGGSGSLLTFGGVDGHAGGRRGHCSTVMLLQTSDWSLGLIAIRVGEEQWRCKVEVALEGEATCPVAPTCYISACCCAAAAACLRRD